VSLSALRHAIGGYREFAPPATAGAFCEAVWIHQTPADAVNSGAAHRVLPDLGVSLAFQGFRDDDGRPVDAAPILVGPKLHAQMFDLVPGRELAAVRIKPEWFGPLFGIDPLAIENRVDDLSAFAPALGARLAEALRRTRSAEQAADALMAEVLRARPRARPPSPLATAALDIVRGTAGRVPCQRLASRLGLSERHLRRHVHDSTGLSPKAFARSVRFVGSMLAADAEAKPVWADLAARAGYCDQSHLIRECVAMSGVAPSALHRERRREEPV
jgi:AraC-like DNA-binding protein